MNPRKHDPAQTLAMLKAGDRTCDIARVQGVSHQRISQLRRKWGIPPLPASQAPLDPKQVRALVKQGLTDRAMASQLGVSEFRVGALRRALGLPNSYQVHERAVRQAHSRNLLHREIAEVVGIPRQTVSDICRRLGLRRVQKVGQPSP